MRNYEYKMTEIIFDPKDERLIHLKGKLVYAGNTPMGVLKEANGQACSPNGFGAVRPGKLYRFVSKDTSSNCPFIVQEIKMSDNNESNNCSYVHELHFPCIIISRESLYGDLCWEWIKKNNIQDGDKVVLKRKAESFEEGWSYEWSEDLNSLIGKTLTLKVRGTRLGVITPSREVRDVPFWVFEKVEKYRPFKDHIEFLEAFHRNKQLCMDTKMYTLLEGIWIKMKVPSKSKELNEDSSYLFKQITSIDNKGVFMDISFYTWEDLFYRFSFLNGEICGVELKEEE